MRKSGLTFAPEAGSQRLRMQSIRMSEKRISQIRAESHLRRYRTLKLYFMIGLPTETDEDVIEIARLADRMLKLSRDIKG